MQIEKFSDNWLFQNHSREKIKFWLQNLKYFSFVRAYGGHSNDGDRFLISFSYTSKEDLLQKLNILKINYNLVPNDVPQPIVGISYPAEVFNKFKILVRKYPEIEQPGIIIINSIRCHVYINDRSINIAISGSVDENYYSVTDLDFKLAKELESFFDSIMPYLEIDHCFEDPAHISEKKYPELFSP